jgi:hypothetical protein
MPTTPAAGPHTDGRSNLIGKTEYGVDKAISPVCIRFGPSIAELIARGRVVEQAGYQRGLQQQPGLRAACAMVFDHLDVLALAGRA